MRWASPPESVIHGAPERKIIQADIFHKGQAAGDFLEQRFGNQGLFAARAMMAMGIFLDNEKIYDRALRYLRSMDAREDDIPYPCQTPVSGSENNAADTNRTHISYNGSWKPSDRQFISDEALQYYIYANGQCQETCRDQGHAMVGVGLYTDLAEMAASQGDDLYGDLDCRILLGLEYSIRYNMTHDWPEPWEPSGYSKTEADCTFDNGVFLSGQITLAALGGYQTLCRRPLQGVQLCALSLAGSCPL